MSFFGWGRAQATKERKVNQLIGRALKSHGAYLLPVYKEMWEYVPEFSNLIMQRTAQQVAKVIVSLETPVDVQAEILELVAAMVDQTDEEKPETDAVKALLSEPDMIPALFRLTRNVDARVIRIMSAMLLRDPMKFIRFIQATEDAVKPLIQSVALSQDEDAGHLLHKIAVSNVAVLKLLTPALKPQLRKYPATIAIDFMVSSAELLEVIPQEDIESWLLQHNRFNIFDVDQLCNILYPFLWNRQISVYVLNRTAPPQQIEHVAWLHGMAPQDFVVSAAEARFASRAVLSFPGEDEPVPQTSRNAYMFVRLYVLSLADPKDLSVDAATALLRLMTDESEWVAAAALQVVFIWLQTKAFVIDCDFVFVIAAASVNKERSPELSALYKAMLHQVGVQHNVAATILMSEPRMQFDMNLVPTILAQKWTFPHFQQYLEKLPDLHLIDYQESCRVLGFMVNYLNASDSIESMGLNKNHEA